MYLNSPLDVAIRRWPDLAPLRVLDGWVWQAGPGQLLGEQWLGWWNETQWINALVIFSPGDAYAARLRVLDADNHEVVWLAEGGAADVLGQLSAVPLPGWPGAPTEQRPVVVLPTGGGPAPHFHTVAGPADDEG